MIINSYLSKYSGNCSFFMKVLIADDDFNDLKLLEARLRAQPDVSIVASLGTLKKLLPTAYRLRPDAVFMDLGFPEGESFCVVDSLHRINKKIVIVSGYSDKAVKAYDHWVFDYLLKPLTSARLALTLDRLRTAFAKEKAADVATQKVVISSRGRVRLLEVDKICHLVRKGNSTFIHQSNGDFLESHEPISSLIDRLPSSHSLFQINRQVAIDLRQIGEVVPLNNQRLLLKTLDGTRLFCAKRRAHDLLERLRRGF